MWHVGKKRGAAEVPGFLVLGILHRASTLLDKRINLPSVVATTFASNFIAARRTSIASFSKSLYYSLYRGMANIYAGFQNLGA